jgi:hypothetical protein
LVSPPCQRKKTYFGTDKKVEGAKGGSGGYLAKVSVITQAASLLAAKSAKFSPEIRKVYRLGIQGSPVEERELPSFNKKFNLASWLSLSAKLAVKMSVIIDLPIPKGLGRVSSWNWCVLRSFFSPVKSPG